ncbi:type IV pilus assembly protein PilC [Leeuwenhoekiella aestuarii]|uniref:type II secretion system F family protein n=1 Tax=Leeuwenhoekiella aestuarii TaxID=2249426 RepID=UPI000FFF614C|nr:type II secretion system F family protein [Leeuwenhoekiella aestuarii]RXG11381.1 type IV pilus assembly protein PilC [Leeuwenhoekiella aestuarii]
MGIKIEQRQSPNRNIGSEKKESIFKKDIIVFSKPFGSKKKEAFYVELSLLLKAGVRLKNGLNLLADAQKKKYDKNLLLTLVTEIDQGKDFSEAVRERKEFSEYEYYSLKIGETTGTLDQVTEALGEYYIRRNEQRRNLISALTYPIIVLSVATLSVIFMLRFIVPMFQDIFKQNNVQLPAITQFIVRVSNAIGDYGLITVLILAAIVLSRKLYVKKPWYRKTRDQVILRVPYIGNFVRKTYLAQFTQAISLLVSAKVPVLRSLGLVKKMILFYPIEDALGRVEEQILKGKSLSESMSRESIFDQKMISLIQVSEETNQTDFIFKRLNELYNQQVTQQAKIFSTALEPIIIMIVAVIVGVILIAMYLPMFGLSEVIG